MSFSKISFLVNQLQQCTTMSLRYNDAVATNVTYSAKQGNIVGIRCESIEISYALVAWNI